MNSKNQPDDPDKVGPLSEDQTNALILKYKGWAEAIAKSVARAWNLDWQMDGLDGAAMEALIFCARRYQPNRGVPFKSYARKRIHEASTEAARRSKGWKRGAGSLSRTERLAREVSADLFNVFPELRSGQIFSGDGEEMSKGARIAIQQLLVGATIIATKHGLSEAQPDELLDYKKMVLFAGVLEPVHQSLLWKVYWEGLSLRTVADEWGTDELNVIREHKVLLEFMQKCLSRGKTTKVPRIRPGLKAVALRLKREEPEGVFAKMIGHEVQHVEG